MLNEVFALVVVNHSLNLHRFQHNDSVIFAALPLNPKVVCGFCDRAVSEHFRVAGTLVRRTVSVVCAIQKLPGLNVLNRKHRLPPYQYLRTLL